MLVYEFKLKGKQQQFNLIDEAIRTALFVRNSCVRYWMDNPKVGKYDLSAFCKELAANFEWANKLNSMARQASADRAWAAISRFYSNCKKKVPGKKGFPNFKKRGHSVEYKTTGWKLSEDRKHLTLTDGFEIGKLKLVGTHDLHFYQIKDIKRVRLVKRADGYYAQFCIAVDREIKVEPSKKVIGLDVGLNHFYTDSNGDKVENPRFLRRSEKALKRLQKRVSKKFKKGNPQSNNYKKARNKLARKHLKVSRQRKDFAVKLARCVIQSNDVVVYEDLQVRNMVKNHKLAKSISDASWYQFRCWLEYFGKVYGKITVAVPPHWTSQNCSNCGETVVKTLSTRTHECPHCGTVLDRDENAALNILAKGLSTTGHVGSNAWGENDLCLDLVTGSDKLAQ
ncbi:MULTISPECIES: RNA-guided endonuclease InsQ/TnpB family protein [unclassified Tolypothrix]|uniref:RNA-guided endonuclease InsQ/TnpB family protein n=1 Tax=unclassified Tolypothrix TaxID=2649714 RepID=UPI0005EAA850|nr:MULTISPECIES: RNA-guided endonuclease TnpB family protein [unclassified Tolypothrix]BAY94382.1 transposase [Microchaete diplosiphon NIES-3275]EKF04025.1 transposase [Tolypothrix sp. PCC 7601]MBE9085722.1 transposase [Tolypothrix sp. LEGE 11397]UYD28104.1 transposase [Tolypothrix sp. PCC 7712]UYD36025.1 transposase [Tolypothrix sp. PCC 7601]